MDATVRNEQVTDKPRSRDSVNRFLRHLAMMTEAGISYQAAFDALSKQEPDPVMKSLIEQMAFDITIGKKLGSLPKKYIGVFNAIHGAVLATAQETGKLAEAVERISSIAETELAAKRRLLHSLLYPMSMVGLALLLLIATPSALVSRFDGFYQATETPHLGFLVLLRLSESFYNLWTYVFLGLVGLAAYRYRALWNRPLVKRRVYQLGYMIPPVARLLDAIVMERICRVMALQVESGVHLLDAFDRLEIVIEDPNVRQKVLDVYRAVKRGEEVGPAIEQAKFRDKAFRSVFEVGMESASLEKLLNAWADDKKLEIEAAIETMNSALGPLSMLLAGGLTAIWVLVMLSPLDGLVNSL